MNKRIRELAEQAGFTVYSGSIWASAPGCESDMYCHDEVKNLTKLIIQDCISQIAMIGVSNCDDPDVVWTVDKAIQNIREHFGVECEEDVDETCPRCGEPDSGTSCGIPDCGWITGVEE